MTNRWTLSRWLALSAATAVLFWVASLSQALSQVQNRLPVFTLDRHATILVEAAAPEPLRRAADDLAADMGMVFGAKPRVISDVSEAGPVLFVLGDRSGPSGVASPTHGTAPEAFSINSQATRLANGRQVEVVRLAGSDLRGTLFALYQFSQEYLGVDPLYYWTDHLPAKHTSLPLSTEMDERIDAPVFRYRGIFLNDEDLLTGWAPGEDRDHTGISLAVWDKVYETVLRLKGNMVVAGTWPFAGEPQDRLAADRGLLLNQHHAEPLGVNFSRWPHDVPYNYTAHPEFIQNAWKHAVAAYAPDQQILWEIGLRGLSDQPYSALDPSVHGDLKAQGHVISKALADQVRIVKASHPDAVFITDLWMEGAELMRSGDLVIPSDVITVWPDTGYGDMQDHGQVRAGQGAYIHVAMFNGRANQLSELTPVDRIFASLGRFQQAEATSFLLVNTSDLRPVTMGTRAVLDFGWKGKALGSGETFYTQWAGEEFGRAAAPALAKMYRAYFQAPAQTDDNDPHAYGDSYYHYVARDLLREAMVQWPTYGLPDQAPAWKQPSVRNLPYSADHLLQQAQRESAACEQAQPRWDAVHNQAEDARRLVDPARREFFQAAVLTMIAINRDSNRMLLEVARGVLALKKGDRAAAAADTEAALAALADLKQQEALAEYGKWKNWYHGDWLTGVDQTRDLLQHFEAFLKDPNTAVPPPIDWSAWEAYYHIQHYQGQRTVDVH